MSAYVAATVLVVIGVSAAAMVDVERNSEDANPTSLSDALCWAATTVTTVGYGDRNPTTGLGRLIALIAVALLLVGISLLGRCDGVCGGVLRQSAPGRTGGRGTHRGDPW